MSLKNLETEAIVFSFKSKLIFVVTGLFISLSMLLFNEKLYQGNEKTGDPLLVLVLFCGLLGGFTFAANWDNKIADRLFAVVVYVSIGTCAGYTIIGTIFNGQPAKWLGLVFLIGIPLIASMANSGKSSEATTETIKTTNS